MVRFSRRPLITARSPTCVHPLFCWGVWPSHVVRAVPLSCTCSPPVCINEGILDGVYTHRSGHLRQMHTL